MIHGQTAALALVLLMLISSPVVEATASEPGEQTISDLPSSGPHPITNGTVPTDPANDTLRDAVVTAGGMTASVSGDRRALTVVLINRTNTAARREALSTYGVSINRQHGRFLDTTMPVANISRVRALPYVERAHLPIRSRPAVVNAASETLNSTQLRSTGITGVGVDVGVIDGGFESSNDEIAGEIVAARSFVGNDLTGRGRTAHGTAVAEVVTDVAPNASLHLAAVGRGTRARFAAAVDWLVERHDVDVIVYSRGLIVAPDDGTSPTSQIAAEAVRSGTAFVAAAGNEAQVHWRGRPTDANKNGAIEFAPGDEANEFRLANERSITVALDWQDWPVTASDYDLYLYRAVEDGEDQLVGRSARPQDGDDAPFELINQRLPAGTYYIVVVRREATGSAPIELTCYSCGEIGNQNPAYSISAPAVAGPVTAVGGYDVDQQALAAYSSRGPTADGRRGIDILGPTGVQSSVYGTFAGTSASAPAIGGAIALLKDFGNDTSPDDTTSALRQTAQDRGDPGPDPVTGFGLADVAAATPQIDGGNQPPIANAGSNKTVAAGTSFTLNASSSRDPDGDSLNYRWELIEGPSISTPPATVQPTLTAPSVSTNRELVFELTVGDGRGRTDTDRVTVSVMTAHNGPGDLTGNGNPATDVDDDGIYEDINGDGRVTTADVTALFNVLSSDSPAAESPQLDINGANDGATAADVTRLFNSIIDKNQSST